MIKFAANGNTYWIRPEIIERVTEYEQGVLHVWISSYRAPLQLSGQAAQIVRDYLDAQTEDHDEVRPATEVCCLEPPYHAK